jgi:hypothetical protein
MKFTILTVSLYLLCACTMFDARQSSTAPLVPSGPHAIWIGKNWQVSEESARLSDERGHLPEKMEPMEPEGANSVSPEEKRKIVTPQ